MKAKATLNQAIIQKIIIISLGLLSYGILLTSCASSHAPCSAYDNVQDVKVRPK